jgi:hypothetical protein
MSGTSSTELKERVTSAAEAVLNRSGSVGPLELFQEMRWLQPCHIQGWRKGNEHYRVLEKWIQVGPEKYEKSIRHFMDWVEQHGLRPVEASYTRPTPHGLETLQVTATGDPEREKFYCTHYVPADQPPAKIKRVSQRLKKAPDLVVFQKVSQEGKCVECGKELFKGNFLFMEKGQPLCLACADLDHLVFLPAGDATLSRRARKHSALSAVVVRFSRSRKRYERQGLLVLADALAQAEEECAADGPARDAARARAAALRVEEDKELVVSMNQEILNQYPGCPPEEAQRIAAHAAVRGSGRVGRSAAGRALEADALSLAVTAHVRHEHTRYDRLLMQGIERLEARALVRDQIESVLAKWKVPRPHSNH